jgi:hypothetical protein
MALEPAADDSENVLVPRAVPGETILPFPGSPQAGETARTLVHTVVIRSLVYQTPSRACQPSSFGPRFGNVNSKTRFLGSPIKTRRRPGLFHV